MPLNFSSIIGLVLKGKFHHFDFDGKKRKADPEGHDVII